MKTFTMLSMLAALLLTLNLSGQNHLEQELPKGQFSDALEIIRSESYFEKINSSVSTEIFFHDFAALQDKWITTGSWQIGAPDAGFSGGNFSFNCAATNLSGNYQNEADDWLISPIIQLPEKAEMIVLRLSEWFSLESYHDIGNVNISLDDGQSWITLAQSTGVSDWRETDIILTTYKGKAIRLGFNLVTDGSIVSDGWYINSVGLNVLSSLPLEANMLSLNAHNFPLIFMNVKVDTFGAAMPTLNQSHFQAFENNVLQTHLFDVIPPEVGGGLRMADIVFLMDNSGSMTPYQNAVENNLDAFINLLMQSDIDYALGLCRFGQWALNGNPILEDNGQLTQNAIYFRDNVWARNVDDGGTEPGYFAITQSAAGFNFRSGSQRIFIIITDESPNQGGATQQEAIDACLNQGINLYAMINNAAAGLIPVVTATNGQHYNITDPFGPILDDIGDAITSTYIVRYSSSDPNCNGLLRNVEVVVTYNAQVDTATGQYIPCQQPTIQRTPETIALHDQAWDELTPFTLEVIVTDNTEPFVNNVKVYHKNTTAATYQNVALTFVADGKWTVTLPPNSATSPGLDYYFTASDGTQTISEPGVNPASNPFQLAILPNVAPAINHVPVQLLTIGQAIDIVAEIIDNTNHLADQTLFYRKVGQILYQAVEMLNTGGNNFSAQIPGSYAVAEGVEYYISAWDDFNVRTDHGTPSSPHLISSSGGGGNEQIFIQPPFDGGTAYASVIDSGFPIDYESADNFYGLEDEIEEFVFYGLAMKWIGGGWQEQIPAANEPFFIRFYIYEEDVAEGLIAPSTGTYQLALRDEWDHWDWGAGSFVSLYINGSIVIENATMVFGDPDPKYYPFAANAGDEISTIYTPGNWADENYYAIIDPQANIIAEEGGTWNNPGLSVPGNIEPGGDPTVSEPDWANPVSEQYITTTVTNEGAIWGGVRQLYKFVAPLNTPVDMEEGWVSAQIDANNGSGTWFLWLNSDIGDGQSWQRLVAARNNESPHMVEMASISKDGSNNQLRDQILSDLAFELWGGFQAVAASVTTSGITNITQTTATGGGNVTSDGGATVTARGICYSTSPNPTTANSTVPSGSGTGSFTANMSGLTPATIYYVRAYATNSEGTAYGNQVSFTTLEEGGGLPDCGENISFTYRGGIVTYGIVERGGLCWMDRNLGASQVATSSTDQAAYGDLFQWGRLDDGHQDRQSSNTSTQSSTDVPGHSSFITTGGGMADWRSPQNDNLWQGSGGINNPCPTGWRVPTSEELNAERLSWVTNNTAGAFASSLKWTVGGYRYANGTIGYVGSAGIYWTSSVSSTNSVYLNLQSTSGMFTFGRAAGMSVRCVRDADFGVSLPEVNTSAITNITQTTATGGGNVTSDGGAIVTARGICYSTSPNPTTANTTVTSGSGTGSFTANMTGLTPGTTYYVRAYATNSEGTAYGGQVQFTTSTPAVVPTVTTASIIDITQTTAGGGGNVTSDGGAAVTVRGICYSTSPNPTTANSTVPSGSGTGSFTANMTGLTPGTTYYVRAYATNSAGTAYGGQVQFTTSTPIVVPTVTTASITNITQTTATGGGNVTSDGGAAVTARGICYSTSPNPTTANSTIPSGSGTGSFTSNMSGLTPGTLYYVRAYATNSAGTAYGGQVQFTTTIPVVVPTVTTASITNITQTTATGGGNVTSDGGAAVTARGICFSTSPNPTTANPTVPAGSGTGSFTANMSGLAPNTTYYVKAYAANSVGTAYGNQVEFTTSMQPLQPQLSVNPNSLNFGDQEVGTNSLSQSYTISYSNLTDDIVVTSNSIHYKVSLSPSSGFGASVTIPVSRGVEAPIENKPDSYALIASSSETKANPAEELYFLDQKEYILRYQKVNLNESVMLYSVVKEMDIIELNLFDNINYSATVKNISQNLNGTTVISTHINGFDMAYAILTTTAGRSLVQINIPELRKSYQIISEPAFNEHYLIELYHANGRNLENGPPRLFIGLDETDLQDQIRIARELETRSVGPDDPANIDVMVVYTPAAEAWANTNGGGIANVIGQAMAKAQLVLDNSQVFMTTTLVHSALVDYAEHADSEVDLDRLYYPDDGYMDEVHLWRDEYGADLVSLFAISNTVGGLGFLLNDIYGIPSIGFSLTRVQQAVSSFTHIHEMGHNMGLHHHAQQNSQPGPTNWINWPGNTWSAGWRWTGNDSGKYCSVMTYESGSYFSDGIDHTRVPYFANPSVNYEGVATGNPSTGDNARTLREIKHVIAAYRNASTTEQATIYARFEPGTTGTLNGVIVNESTGATTQNVTVTGVGIDVNLPIVTTANITNITQTTATGGGNVTSDGGSAVTTRGICYSTNPNPTTANSTVPSGIGTGSFTSNMSGLTPGTLYYVRAYATNSAGTAYGNQVSFVTAEEGCEPDWVPMPNLQYNMQVVAQIIIDDQPSLNPNDVLGAFVGGECRGIASPLPAVNGLVFLTVGSNMASGEQVELRIWNSNTCQSCDAGPGFAFVNQSELGTFLNPYLVACDTDVELDLNFGQGYTWFSVNVNPGDMGPNTLFADLSPCYDDRIIGQTSFALYTGETWVGGLTQLAHQSMYRMKLCSPQTLNLIGAPAPLDPINLSPGYTWLGYLPQQCQPINQALTGLVPAASYDDRLIGQNAFALYNGTQWVGTLTSLCPGRGYIIRLANSSVLTYTEATAKYGEGSMYNDRSIVSPTGFEPDNHMQHSMMLLAKVDLGNGQFSLNPADVVYAYIGEEVHGMAIPIPELGGAVFLSIGANSTENFEVSFKMWSNDHQSLIDINENVVFEPLKAIGNWDEPFILTLKNMVGITDLNLAGWHIGEPFPNPFTDQTIIPYSLSTSAQVKVQIYNSLGQIVHKIEEKGQQAGRHQLKIDRGSMRSGVYHVAVKISTDYGIGLKHFKIIIE